MRLFIIILLFSFVCYSQNAVVISNTRANKLKGEDYMPGVYFNPIKDSLGRWVISIEEVINNKDTNFYYLKTMPVIRYMKPKDTVDIFSNKL